MANDNDYSGVREYIGARYVPIMANPIEWDNGREYEPLTVVTYQGNSYTSTQRVPTGIDITNTEFWALTGNYNAQVEAYRQEVQRFDERITANANDITNEVSNREEAIANETTARENAIANVEQQVSDLMREKADDKTELVIIGDSWSDSRVEDSVWANLFAEKTGLNLHLYAQNGANLMNSTLQPLFHDFINDTSYDKSKIKYFICMFGVNDQFIYKVPNSTITDSYASLFNSVLPLLPEDVQIHHFINFTFGFTNNSASAQAYTWYGNVIPVLRSSIPRYVAHYMHPWFSAFQMNTTNWFHLTKTAQTRELPDYVYMGVNGGDIQPAYITSSATIPTTKGGKMRIDCVLRDTYVQYNIKNMGGTESEFITTNSKYPMPTLIDYMYLENSIDKEYSSALAVNGGTVAAGNQLNNMFICKNGQYYNPAEFPTGAEAQQSTSIILPLIDID